MAKERRVKMKVLEMLTMLEKDKTLEFKLTNSEHEITVGFGTYKSAKNTIIFKTGSCTGEPFIINDYILKYNCTLVEKPVTFMEAVNSGNLMRYEKWEYNDFRHLDDVLAYIGEENYSSQCKEILNGKWYIKQ